jgi:hypothetical protein
MSLYCRLLCLSPAVIATLGCMTETVDLTPVWAVIYGTVRSDAGSPVPGARIALRTQPEGVCPAIAHTSVNVGTIEAFADAGGAYRAEVLYLAWPHEETRDFCVHLVATPPLAGGFQDTAFSVGPLRFSSIVSDSARADVVLSLP